MKYLIILLIFILSYSVIPTYYYKLKGIMPVKKMNNDKFLCLTFDDGPDERYTYKLLELLKNYNVKATFFLVAKQAEKNYKIIKRMEEEGHTIGLHSLEHKSALIKGFSYTNKDFKESLKIMKKLNINIKYFRPPWGQFNIATLLNIRKYNLSLVLWNVIIGDWKADISADEIANRLMSKTKNKSIICLHDGRGENGAPSRTIAALEVMLPIWKEQNYKFFKVDELNE